MVNKEKPISELLEFSVLNIDKPSGPTSFSVSDFIRKKIKEAGVDLRKTCHFGTLDPKVTGVLPIGLGRACKLTGFVLGHDKTYVGLMHINKEMSIEELQKIIDKNFIGKIIQLPPKKSRVKRQEREREIKQFKILEKGDGERDKEFLFEAEVQGGTYIRKLIHDLGEIEEIGGAHMTELRRIKAGIFEEKNKEFVNLYDFEKAVNEFKDGKEKKLREMLIPAESVIKRIMPYVKIKEDSLKMLLNGKPLMKKDLDEEVPNSEIFAVFCEERFVEIARKIEDKGDIIAKPEFVKD